MCEYSENWTAAKKERKQKLEVNDLGFLSRCFAMTVLSLDNVRLSTSSRKKVYFFYSRLSCSHPFPTFSSFILR